MEIKTLKERLLFIKMSHEEEFNAYWIIVNFGLTMEVDVSKHQQLSKIIVDQNGE